MAPEESSPGATTNMFMPTTITGPFDEFGSESRGVAVDAFARPPQRAGVYQTDFAGEEIIAPAKAVAVGVDLSQQ